MTANRQFSECQSVVTKRFLDFGNRPVLTDTIVPVSKETVDKLARFCDLIYFFGEEIVGLYYEGHSKIKYFVEYGLPDVYLDLLKSARNVPLHKALFRFDFFFSETGPKLVEISSNPWGLLSYEAHTEAQKISCAHLPATEIYCSLCNRLSCKRIGIWGNFNFVDDTADLIAKLQKLGIIAEKVDTTSALDRYDGIFYDIETAYFDGSLAHLIPHASRLLPSPTNEIIKRKNFLAFIYLFSTGKEAIPSKLTKGDKEFINEFLAPAFLIPDQLPTAPHCGVIKDVIGIWGLQVTILSPRLANAHGSDARKKRNRFRQHLKNAVNKRNAILQNYIAPVAISNSPELFTEFSLVYSETRALPFARIYKGTPQTKANIGFGLVNIEGQNSAEQSSRKI